MRAIALDAQIEQRFLEALRPDQLTLALAALAQVEQEEHAAHKQWELRIDFVAVLIGYAVSGEPTLLAFYERLTPFAEPFMALFGRDQLPRRSTLSRFLAALDQNA